MKSFKNLIIPILLIIAISAGIMINNQNQVETALNTENLIKKDLKVKKVESTSIWVSNYKVSFENYDKEVEVYIGRFSTHIESKDIVHLTKKGLVVTNMIGETSVLPYVTE